MTSQHTPVNPQDDPALITHLDAVEDDFHDAAPLLGPPGSVDQASSRPLRMNVVLGTAPLAQIGIWALTLTVWFTIIFLADWIFFSFHPFLNSAALLLTTNSVLLLQPTHTPEQKYVGAITHGILNGTAFIFFTTAVAIIFINKNLHNAAHFTTAHGRIGLFVYILLLIQTSIGITMFYFPQVFGSVAKGKAIWKYHRASGYIVWTLVLVNCVLGTQSTWFLGVWNITWIWVVFAIVALLGVVSRIRLSKMKIF